MIGLFALVLAATMFGLMALVVIVYFLLEEQMLLDIWEVEQ